MQTSNSAGDKGTGRESWASRWANAFVRDSVGATLTAHVVVMGDPKYQDDFMPDLADPRESVSISFGSAPRRNSLPPRIGTRASVPPFELKDGRRLHQPESALPKPRAWFDPDNLDGEEIKLVFEGPKESRRRYVAMAAACWREFLDAKLPKPLSALRARTLLAKGAFDSDEDQARLWTLLMFLISWQNDGPRALKAKRWTWVPGHPKTKIEAETPHIEMWFKCILEQRGTPADIAARNLSDSRKHFCATMRPDAFTASAEALLWINIRLQDEHGKPHSAKTTLAGVTAPRQLKQCVLKAGKAMEHFIEERDDLTYETGRLLMREAWAWARKKEYPPGRCIRFPTFCRYVREYYRDETMGPKLAVNPKALPRSVVSALDHPLKA